MLERMFFFVKLCKVDENLELGMWLFYGMIIILSIFVYNLGFVRKLFVLKNIVIYILLVIGCIVLIFFVVFLFVGEGFVVVVIVFGIYRLCLC